MTRRIIVLCLFLSTISGWAFGGEEAKELSLKEAVEIAL